MNLIKNDTKLYKDINQDVFLMLLKNQKIEEAIEKFIDENIEINYNRKQRYISKKTWIKYLKRTLLNKSTEVIQFKIEKMLKKDENSTFRVFVICKKIKGTFDLTEISVSNIWNDNYIHKLQYKLTSY
ncbi:hypothetical protein A9Q86_01360 [Flavobacteriales bacterium 33_180_T64]|nr:hypothetical protein A9Q86_01360 [Flavobacteriales bacterium 33_180_T64]